MKEYFCEIIHADNTSLNVDYTHVLPQCLCISASVTTPRTESKSESGKFNKHQIVFTNKYFPPRISDKTNEILNKAIDMMREKSVKFLDYKKKDYFKQLLFLLKETLKRGIIFFFLSKYNYAADFPYI